MDHSSGHKTTTANTATSNWTVDNNYILWITVTRQPTLLAAKSKTVHNNYILWITVQDTRQPTLHAAKSKTVHNNHLMDHIFRHKTVNSKTQPSQKQPITISHLTAHSSGHKTVWHQNAANSSWTLHNNHLLWITVLVLQGYGTAAARAALPIPISVCRIFSLNKNVFETK